jgi:predicted transcriptional regulator
MRTAYDTDFAQWTSEQSQLLRAGHFDQLDVEHIIEELDGLKNSERREILHRLQTMIEHMMKRDLFPTDDSLRGWNVTIRRSAREIADLLGTSPSFIQYLTAEATWTKAFRNAREIVMIEYTSKKPDDDAKRYFDAAMREIEAATD